MLPVLPMLIPENIGIHGGNDKSGNNHTIAVSGPHTHIEAVHISVSTPPSVLLD